MDLQLTGKVAIVTGASRGIGRAIAETLAAEGMRLTLVARTEKQLQDLAASLSTESLVKVANLEAPDAPADVVAETMARFGRIDLLVNNAGATKRGDFFALTDQDWADGFALKFFGAMRPGSYFINTSRAEIVDQAALAGAVKEKGLRVGLDVFAGEPSGGVGTVEDDIFKLDGVIGTHHIGASTDQAQQAIAEETVRIIREYKATGRAPNVVNLAKKTAATHMLVVRHFDRVGVLASVFDQLKTAGINVEETENIVFDGAAAAVARIHLDSAPSDEVLNAIKTNSQHIIELSLLKL